jgi:hypothetical protein
MIIHGRVGVHYPSLGFGTLQPVDRSLAQADGFPPGDGCQGCRPGNMSILKKLDVCLTSARPIRETQTSRFEKIPIPTGEMLMTHPDCGS